MRRFRPIIDAVVRNQAPAAEAVRNLLTAGAVLAAGVLLCIVRAPKPLDTTDGLSWFGVTGDTVLEYALTLLVTAALLVRAAAPLAAVPELRPLRVGLLACAALLPVMLATPYTVSSLLNWIHMIVGAVLFVLQILVAAWLWWARARTAAVFVLLAVEVLAGVLCFTSLIDVVSPAMLYGQLLFQLAFTACVAVGVATVATLARPSFARSRRLL
jgi:hypothetical protein